MQGSGDEDLNEEEEHHLNNQLPSYQQQLQLWKRDLVVQLKTRALIITNIWSFSLVITVIIALVYRSLQPVSEPSVSIRRLAWTRDPSSSLLSISELELDAKKQGRYMVTFDSAMLEVSYLSTADANNGTNSDGPETLAQIAVPPWDLDLGESSIVLPTSASTGPSIPITLSASNVSTPISPSPSTPHQQNASILITGVFRGTIQVYASLPCTIEIRCKIRDTVTPETPHCISKYALIAGC